MVSFQRSHSLEEICRGLESMMSVVVFARILMSSMFLIYFTGYPVRPMRKKSKKGRNLSGHLEKRITGSSPLFKAP
jgi:hypothetical protein